MQKFQTSWPHSEELKHRGKILSAILILRPHFFSCPVEKWVDVVYSPPIKKMFEFGLKKLQSSATMNVSRSFSRVIWISLLLTTANLPASIFVSTFSSSPDGGAGVGFVTSQDFGIHRGLSFTTDSNPYTLTSIALRAREFESGILIGSLFAANSNNLPTGPFLGGFNTPTFSTSDHTIGLFTPTSTITLEANTRYVFTLTTAAGAGAGRWEVLTIRNSFGFTRPDGGSWNYENTFPSRIYGVSQDPESIPWADSNASIADPVNSNRFHTEISAVIIPEPHSLALCSVGLIILGIGSRRSARRNSLAQ